MTMIKDPDDVLDYVWPWGEWLGDDTIASHEIIITPDDGLTKQASAISGTDVVVWLSGGTLGTNVDVTCRIVTAGGRTKDRTETFLIRAQ